MTAYWAQPANEVARSLTGESFSVVKRAGTASETASIATGHERIRRTGT